MEARSNHGGSGQMREGKYVRKQLSLWAATAITQMALRCARSLRLRERERERERESAISFRSNIAHRTSVRIYLEESIAARSLELWNSARIRIIVGPSSPPHIGSDGDHADARARISTSGDVFADGVVVVDVFSFCQHSGGGGAETLRLEFRRFCIERWWPSIVGTPLSYPRRLIPRTDDTSCEKERATMTFPFPSVRCGKREVWLHWDDR
ncbi:hypothetical protein BZA05DRAFT_75248 [Tricharina praecox]|uniref:uncharacterized protein n=1 Tax=Tricharina praecox TaxID=43433 RepID=UPI0022208E55|nr:uncharacterized protein BZA05DRAFT_75248 [Tricharina praecox]KAI5849726.1 hypothetical protein BZA05DRAFT_75248 [Tricharina praecox]